MTAPTKAGEIVVRHCHGIEEFKVCFALQQAVWGKSDIDIPVPMFAVAAETGGQVLGAYDGERMVGFTLAIAGWRDGRAFIHSHMTAVLEDYRDRGIGRRLKLFQRDDAIERGIFLVEWTFDPLEVKNAYFNLMRLGAIARRYLPNVYGVTSSPLHGGIPTDRLVAEWWLVSPRVNAVLAASANAPQQSATQQSAPHQSSALHSAHSHARAQILVPADLPAPRQSDLEKSVAVQSKIRDGFQRWIAKGYAATAVEVADDGARYILEPWKDSA
jgi:predicted GNAT superfamily acetyltransferase